MTTTWRTEILAEMKRAGEEWADVEATTLTDEELDLPFNDGFGGTEGLPFTLWTHARVYFPWQYDGSEGCTSVARHPDGLPTEHVGGG